MKSFNIWKKSALTLAELLISITISSILFFIVFTFLSNNINRVFINKSKTNSTEQWFDFKDSLTRTIRWWSYEPIIFTWSTNPNDVLFLKWNEWLDWFIFWVVNLETKKIQKDYVFWDNYIGYRALSSTELNEIDLNKDIIYDFEFNNDKIFQFLKIKDFDVELYNKKEIIDIYMAIILLWNVEEYWKKIDEIFFEDTDILKYNLVF